MRRADFAGWWRSERTGRAGFEALGRRWGLVAGLVSILAGLAWLVLTRH
ncbi:hypothetical protein GGQ91_000888 [Methylobacterium fujisawaense]|uniref:Uncharacterized protein n=1 Tax=Methylobacterium fujisawaense TaxID=107400 RepID=A0ABR6D706_9HYPH|nr:hypothetical protein [Methylobacterium fujisawaense]MBA9061527.1 hypothetical protein [Methylobacterium fujisawaense]